MCWKAKEMVGHLKVRRVGLGSKIAGLLEEAPFHRISHRQICWTVAQLASCSDKKASKQTVRTMTHVDFSGRYEVYVNIDHFHGNRQVSDQTTVYIYIFQILPELQKQTKMAMPFQTDTTVSMSICKSHSKATDSLPKDREAPGKSADFPARPKSTKTSAGLQGKLLGTVVWSITSSSQPKLSSPTTSKSSAVLFSAKFTSSILHLCNLSCTYMIEHLFAKPQANITKRMRRLVYHRNPI